ncbi:extracellular medium-chain-length polyhydroxyalkanoate depolymerase [Pseudomaricurvus albidus]|uniref:extracellular medium-chain-length polyhydroxyalkanoate depolymerase n=1 Tax=Pseudomaricurvus albidus TaxID=2842452 RepID=UPI003F6FC0B5
MFFVSQGWADSRCSERSKTFLVPGEITCSYRSLTLPSGALTSREVKYELPLGQPPAGGWPVAIVYQGSLFPVEFSRTTSAPFGGFYELKTIKKLLDNGYAVLAPRAPAELAWLTNAATVVSDNLYHTTTDYTFLTNVLQAIKDGTFGPLNPDRQYATGISSGGYNSSRMAVSFPGEFKALVIHSGSYAECLGPVCVVPLQLPDDHPPTYFIHGLVDTIVPWSTMDSYYDRLRWEGVTSDRHTNTLGGHEWFPESANLVLNWFERFQ